MVNIMFCKAHVVRCCHGKDGLDQGLEVSLEWQALTAGRGLAYTVTRTPVRQVKTLNWGMMVLVHGILEYRSDE